jgi:hypothetical protein
VLQNGASAADHMNLLLIFRFDGHNYELPAWLISILTNRKIYCRQHYNGEGILETEFFIFFHIPDGIMYSYRYHITNGDNSKPTNKATLQITSWLSRVNSFIHFKSFHWFIS